MEYFVESEMNGEVSWTEFADVVKAREYRDHMRRSGAHALVHHSTVETRSKFANWQKCNNRQCLCSTKEIDR